MEYRIPAGTSLLIHRTRNLIGKVGPHPFRHSDYARMASTHDVVYDEKDVFYDPTTNLVTRYEEYGIRSSPWITESTHWGFSLPKNDKLAAFMFVPVEAVSMIAEFPVGIPDKVETPERLEAIRAFIKQLTKDDLKRMEKQLQSDFFIKNPNSLFDWDPYGVSIT